MYKTTAAVTFVSCLTETVNEQRLGRSGKLFFGNWKLHKC